MLRCPISPELRRTRATLDRWTNAPCDDKPERALIHRRTHRECATAAFPGTRAPFEERHFRTAAPVISDRTAPSPFAPSYALSLA